MELDIKKLKSKVDNNQKEVIGKLNILENKFDDLELKKAIRHTEIVYKAYEVVYNSIEVNF